MGGFTMARGCIMLGTNGTPDDEAAAILALAAAMAATALADAAAAFAAAVALFSWGGAIFSVLLLTVLLDAGGAKPNAGTGFLAPSSPATAGRSP
jgi:hypothetical protein